MGNGASSTQSSPDIDDNNAERSVSREDHLNATFSETDSLLSSSVATSVVLYGVSSSHESAGPTAAVSASSSLPESASSPLAVTDEEEATTTPPTAAATDEEQSTGGASTTTETEETSRDGAVATLTRRLRCLFSIITWPIVPLGTIVALALLWVFYAAASLDVRRSCSHPLHVYAALSLVLVTYFPYHANTRARLFRYSRERDGPIRPTGVRIYDQVFHTICLMYVYMGVTLMQTCREDMVALVDQVTLLDTSSESSTSGPPSSYDPSSTLNTCSATCPNLYQAMSVYVATLELFTFALILPLLFLPCIYLWFLRRATVEADAIAQLQERLEEEQAFLRHGGITTKEVLQGLEQVKLVSRKRNHHSNDDNRTCATTTSAITKEVFLISTSATTIAKLDTDSQQATECCICMNEFLVTEEEEVDQEADIETGGLRRTTSSNNSLPHQANAASSANTDETIVRTRCGHLFHEQCLASWIGGKYTLSSTEDDGSTNDRQQRRRACQIACPLCREDLRRPAVPD